MAESHDPSIYSSSDLTYNSYLKIPELLALQKPLSSPEEHDEMLFIVIHQAYELWFKLILQEVGRVMRLLGEGDALNARHHLNRSVEIMKLLVTQISILETLRPVDFLRFRNALKPASGFQSLQFRELEFVMGLKDERYFSHFKNRPEMLERLKARAAEPDFRACLFDFLRAQGLSVPKDAATREGSSDAKDRESTAQALLPVMREPNKYSAIYLLLESVVDFEMQVTFWRERHVRVVERVIGFKRGTGGSSGVEYLQSTTTKKFFPSLWEVRTMIPDEPMTYGGGDAPPAAGKCPFSG